MLIEILGTLVGLLYLYWEYRADRLVWVAGAVQPALSLYVYWQAGLYADFGINVYFLLAALYGLMAWGGTKEERPIQRMRARLWPPIAAATLALWGALGWVLVRLTDSTVPWWDAFTTALSVVGLWMMARKWTQQWLAWIVVDAVSAALYIYKGIYFYAALYAAYTVVAYFGYRAWERKIQVERVD